MTGPLEIVAMAARTPVGLTARSSAAAVRAGISRLREFPFATATGQPVVLGTDPLLDDAQQGFDRMQVMLEAVLEQVVQDVGPQLAALPHGCDVALALPDTRPGFSDDDADALVDHTRKVLTRANIRCEATVTRRGQAGGLEVLHHVAQTHATRPANDPAVFIILALDSHHHMDTLLWLESQQRLALEGLPSGFTPGEAAAGLVLTNRATRQSWRRPSLGRIAGTGYAQESRLRDSETGSFGVALSQAVHDAAASLSLPTDAAEHVFCNINGERYRSEEWAFFALRSHRAVRSLDYHAPCDCWGDVGAAFGPLAMILATETLRHHPDTRALVMAGSDAGQRCAVFLEAP